MAKKKYTAEQIIGMLYPKGHLREVEILLGQGQTIGDLLPKTSPNIMLVLAI